MEAGRVSLPAAILDRADWHDRHAAILLEIERKLETAPDAATRDALLDRLSRAASG